MTRDELILAWRPDTQESMLELAATCAIADHGAMPDHLISAASTGLAQGVFGDEYEAADYGQRRLWDEMAEHAYRRMLAVYRRVQH